MQSLLSDSAAIHIANLLEIDPAIVIHSTHAERAKKPEERAILEGIIEKKLENPLDFLLSSAPPLNTRFMAFCIPMRAASFMQSDIARNYDHHTHR